MRQRTGDGGPEAPRRGRGQAGLTLIEVLVSLIVLGILTTMVLITWFALQNSFAFSVNANDSREAARDAVSRMTVTIRDAQDYTFSYQTGTVKAISVAEASRIVINTSYQEFGNDQVYSGTDPTVKQAAFVYVKDDSVPQRGKIYYVTDDNNNGLLTDELNNPANKGDLVVDHVINNVRPSATNPTSVFTYTYFADDGTVTTTDASGLPSGVPTARIFSVQIHVLIDLDPGHAPVYMDLQSTAQPRNMRPQT